MFAQTTYRQRRQQLCQRLGHGLIVLLGNDESGMNFRDNWYHFRQDSSFSYYFGLNLPSLVAVLDADSGEEILFAPEQSLDDIIWTGPLPSMEEQAEQVGVRTVRPLEQAGAYLASKSTVHYLPPYRPEHVLKLAAWTEKAPAQVAAGASVALIEAVVAQRAVKSAEEVQELHAAATGSARMQLAALHQARAGMREFEVAAEALRSAQSQGLQLSYPLILTTQGQVLHNHYLGNTLQAGDLLLFDGGVETARYYAGDLTRTFPVSATFSARQRELYQVVLDAQLAAIAALRPGVRFLDVHLLACQKLVEGLIQVGLMRGNAEEAVRAGAHTMFFQCGLGHMLGLDVHDMESLGETYVGYTRELRKSTAFGLKSLRLGRELQAGFAVTIEPGIYIIPELIDQKRGDATFQRFINFERLDTYRDFGGIRIEDDFIITEHGSQLLGEPLAKTVAEIEAIRGQALS
ncbi:aminopeptidase P family protein [Hymenobacter persicinus]|uniref:Xaa-Pro aminopeptidase n=1 Tax=Hymenobacter persicinus TaxID=2025506 RepID=A0A4Q5L9P9_9BACT|nr:aminopeptidase P family protein [Hymenobacter persicinus]RYU78531.1 aminopeptidase P family protein [Hymenobacter persicinus]